MVKNFQPGEIVVLVEGRRSYWSVETGEYRLPGMSAAPGATAVVCDPPYNQYGVVVKWLRTDGLAARQHDGAYNEDQFERMGGSPW